MKYQWVKKGMLGVLCQAVLCAVAWSQPLELSIDRGFSADGVRDYDFSWVYWWEANGQAYLREAVAGRELPVQSPATRRFQRDAVAALIPLVGDRDPDVREQAVLALARIGYEQLEVGLIGADGVPRASDRELSDLLIDDPSEGVRTAAWLAMGLLETPRCRAYLAQPVALPEAEQAARVAAIGLLTELDEAHLTALSALLTDPQTSDEVKRWVVWAVDRHDTELPRDRRDAVYRWALDNVASPFVMMQVLNSTGYIGRNGGVDRLVQVIRYYPSVREWPGYEAVRSMPPGLSHGSSATRIGMETRIAATMTLARLQPPERERDRAELRETLVRRAMAGNRLGTLDFNRGADTIAFALLCDATTEDLAVLYDLLRGYTVLPADQADPSIPVEDLNELDLLDRQSANPVRGYAALAIGLLIRRETRGTALHAAWTRPHLEGIELERLKRRFGERLARGIADDNESIEFRAACALALGLTGDPRYIPELTQELGRLQGGDEAVLGYGLLALSMLGDERAADPARRYVTRPGAVGGTGDLVGRRAAIQALAVVGERGGQDARDTLRGAWGKDPWLGIEVGRATFWSGLYDAVPAMLTSTRSAEVRWRIAGAIALGAALDRTYPARIEALGEGFNYTLSVGRLDSEGGADDRRGPGGLPGLSGFPPSEGDLPGAEPVSPALQTHSPAGWPQRKLHARGNLFLYERLLAPARQ